MTTYTEAHARYYAENRETILKKVKVRYLNNRDEILESGKRRRAADPERFKADDKRRYYDTPKGEKQRAVLRERYATEDGYKQAVLQRNLLRKYGMDWDAWEQMFTAQGGKCLGCRESLVRSGRKTHVDHCHTSKKVRGLLCSKCNRVLGCTGDSARTLERLAAYLRRCPTLGGTDHQHEERSTDAA